MEQDAEKERIKLLELIKLSHQERNERAKKKKWYGSRLAFLMTFYGRNQMELAVITQVNPNSITQWRTNLRKPSKSNIERLAFFFEVPVEFFTDKEITIKITEQLTVNYENNEKNGVQGSPKRKRKTGRKKKPDGYVF